MGGRRWRRGLAACSLAWALGAGACGPQDLGLASFVDTPFGQAGASLSELPREELEEVMTLVYTRFASYLELRSAIPFADLLVDACVTSVEQVNGGARFQIDVPCAFEEAEDAAGTVVLVQRDRGFDPVVTEVDVTYVGVTVAGVEVTGRENIVETAGSDGASVRQLDLVQSGVELVYEFRLGLLGGEQVVLDYQIETSQGTLLVRLTDPQTPGAAATVFVTGLDGTVECELRNVPWEPGAEARGFCDNGLVFGLPQSGD